MSKRILQHPTEPATGRKYWRSLGQLGDTPEFRGWLEREFPQGASELKGGEVSRRNFLQLMGASMALAGLSFAGCRRPEKHLVPFTRGVEWSIPGKPLFYTTARPTRRGYAPLVATTHDGRPTKIEGNPLHPVSKGTTDMHAQSSVLDLYDPERARFFVHKGECTDAAAFEKAIEEIAKGPGDGAGLAFLLEKDNSPTRERLRGEIAKKFPQATWTVYEPLGGELAEKAAAVAFGEGVTAVPLIDKADVIMALDCDFLGTEGDVSTIREFSARRKIDLKDGPNSKMNRLYVAENRYTITGGIADHRARVPASQIGAFALAVAAEIAGLTKDAALGELTKGFSAPTVKFNSEWIKVSAGDLVEHKGASLVLVGARQPAAVQVLVAGINAALGNLGKTIVGRKVSEKPVQTLAQLAKSMDDAKVQTLVVVGGNPVYNAPVDLDFAAKLKKVPNVIRLGHAEDETTAHAHWNAPLAHYLESWGDGLAADGSYLSVQPMILPLFGAWSALDLLAKFAGQPKPTGPELVQETFKAIAKPGEFVSAWAKFLHDGFLGGSAAQVETLAFNAPAAAEFVAAEKSAVMAPETAFEVVFTGCAKVDDGRFANNGWLQEIPDPITKVTWDNAALISPATAKKLGVGDNEDNLIRITIGNRSLELAAIIAPGHADGSISVALGYGRTAVGRVGRDRGFNAYPLRTTAQSYFATGATAEKVSGDYKLALTQEHWALEGRGGDLTREAKLTEYKADPEFAKTMGMDAHIPANVSLYTNPPLNKPDSTDPHAWGMVVDLNTCIGCTACTVACQAENNIPIVGKEQVMEGREMHWIRTDRYFASNDPNDPEPEMVSQPMMCQHCENAPCETVCPVNATVHSEDGLNVMAYNRCIGTRYCANNCPFKVRRFNWFDFNQRDVLGHEKGKPFTGLYAWNLTAPKGAEDTVKMSKNPNVTVRMRGVMEKCTFCVQRIQEAKIATKVAVRDSGDVRIPADAFKTACAQACPADAITFGDINNPESSVSKLKASERGYRLLEYLNVGSRVTYLARIRNPHKNMPGFDKVGEAMKSTHAQPKVEHETGGTH
ncbi:MAG: TAT-variant-translocated molybdopterin oxidoreductase [Chthoniobacter sp.]|nr:TAT-variant-translocated molybdopterin oxidoreductase [Chthoniobacter sp.]